MPIDNIDRTVGISTTPIPGRLRSVASFGGVAEAGEIIDDNMQASQSQINSEVNNKLIALEEAIQGSYTPIEVEDHLSTTSEKPVQNKVISNALNSKIGTNDIDSILTTKIGEQNLVNSNYLSSNYYNKNQIDTTFATKQEISSIVQAEVDPIFTESPASQITTQDITNWNNKQNALNITALDIENGTPIATIGNITIKAPTAGQTVFQQSDWNEENVDSASYIWNKPVALSEFENDLNFLTPNNLTEYAKTKDIPAATSDLTNDSGFLTAHQDISGKANISDLAAVATSGNYSDLNGTPDLSNYLPLTGGIITGILNIDASNKSNIPLTINYDVRKSLGSGIFLQVNEVFSNEQRVYALPTGATQGTSPRVYTLASDYSPHFSGSPTASVPSEDDNSARIATTSFVKTAIDNSVLVTNTLSEGTIVATINDTNIRVPVGNVIVEDKLDSDSTQPVQNKVISNALDTIRNDFYENTSNIFIVSHNNNYSDPADKYLLNVNFDYMAERYTSTQKTLAVNYDGSIYYMDIVNTDGIDPNKFEYVRTTFNGNVLWSDRFIITKDTTQQKGYIITRSTNSITFSFNSVSGTLNITTTNNNSNG